MSLLLDALNKGRTEKSDDAGAAANASPGATPLDIPLELSLAADEPPPAPAFPQTNAAQTSAAAENPPPAPQATPDARQAQRWWKQQFNQASGPARARRVVAVGVLVVAGVGVVTGWWWVGQPVEWLTALGERAGWAPTPAAVAVAQPDASAPMPPEDPPVAQGSASDSSASSSGEASTASASGALPAPASLPAAGKGGEGASRAPSAARRSGGAVAARPAVGSARPATSQPAAAEPQLRVERDPLDILREQADAAVLAARWDEAQRSYEAWLERQPDDPAALAGLALALHRQQRWSEAWLAYQRAVQRWPDNPTLRSGALAVLTRLDPALAESRLRDWIADNPGDALAHAALGTLLARQQRWAMAIEPLQQAVRLVPGDAVYHYNLALALERLNRLDQALMHYRQSVTLGDAALPLERIERHIRALQERRAQMQNAAAAATP
ncbi:MAG: tetratricopeptide repeat protein [Tepidimonas sp.]|uniref:tetratricopeptide repeat protein n=1 Tax=Tepidimonas sp. TaxID=2002775 RepID=UPI00259F62B9|nr:tetratricopeptide repeat protein [Tepidimonas sp.]MDM7457723.1 tetratricopeptide repeat protein [Tepidimonas sp.]